MSALSELLLSDKFGSECFYWIVEQVHGHEVFLTDRFNADPHPGNIICMADGRLGLIDYGRFTLSLQCSWSVSQCKVLA